MLNLLGRKIQVCFIYIRVFVSSILASGWSIIYVVQNGNDSDNKSLIDSRIYYNTVQIIDCCYFLQTNLQVKYIFLVFTVLESVGDFI